MYEQFWFLYAAAQLTALRGFMRQHMEDADLYKSELAAKLEIAALFPLTCMHAMSGDLPAPESATRGLVRKMAEASLPVRLIDGIAVVSVRGVMVKSAPLWAVQGGYVASSQLLTMVMRAAAVDSSVRGVLLDIDSPGGSVSGNFELTRATRALSALKPVHAFANGLAASAAYRVASAAGRLTVGAESMVGSIGTILTLLDASKYFEKAGIEVVTISTGKFKAAGAFGTEITEEQRADFQRIVDRFFAGFRADVLEGRNMSEAQLDQVADGRVFIGSEAVDLQLADAVATLEQAIGELSAGAMTRSDDGLARAKARQIGMRARLTGVGSRA